MRFFLLVGQSKQLSDPSIEKFRNGKEGNLKLMNKYKTTNDLNCKKNSNSIFFFCQMTNVKIGKQTIGMLPLVSI